MSKRRLRADMEQKTGNEREMSLDLVSIHENIVHAIRTYSVSTIEEELQELLDILSIEDLSQDIIDSTTERAQELRRILSKFADDNLLNSYISEVTSILAEYTQNGNTTRTFGGTNPSVCAVRTQLEDRYIAILMKYKEDLDLVNFTIPQSSSIAPSSKCTCAERTIVEYEHGSYCDVCGSEVESGKQVSTYSDGKRMSSSNTFKYNRVTYFVDIVKAFQGIVPKVPDAVIEKVRMNLNPEVPLEKLYPCNIRSILCTCKHSKYYKHVMYIWSQITNKPCPNLSHLMPLLIEDIKALEVLFFDEYKDTGRTSFPNYQYILYQLLNKHNHPYPLEYFNMLQTDRLRILDEVVESMFEKLEWTGFKRIS